LKRNLKGIDWLIPVTFPLISNYVLKTLRFEEKTIHFEGFLAQYLKVTGMAIRYFLSFVSLFIEVYGLINKPGRLKFHKVFAIRSASYLCRWTQTICHTRQTSDLKHNSREDEADTCRASSRGELQR
jgi:hypothetical protein